MFYVCFVDLYISFFIPLKHLILCQTYLWYSSQHKEENTTKPFFVRHPFEEFEMIMKKQKQNQTKPTVVTINDHVNSLPNVEI